MQEKKDIYTGKCSPVVKTQTSEMDRMWINRILGGGRRV